MIGWIKIRGAVRQTDYKAVCRTAFFVAFRIRLKAVSARAGRIKKHQDRTWELP